MHWIFQDRQFRNYSSIACFINFYIIPNRCEFMICWMPNFFSKTKREGCVRHSITRLHFSCHIRMPLSSFRKFFPSGLGDHSCYRFHWFWFLFFSINEENKFVVKFKIVFKLCRIFRKPFRCLLQLFTIKENTAKFINMLII